VLKIDLLPKRFAIARKNKWILAIGIIFLVVVGAGFWVKAKAIHAEIAKIEQATADVKPTADDVRKLETETSEKQGWLDPIKAKIDFVEKADKTGEEYFDRFHSINKYIWAEPQMPRMSSFSITGGSSVQFTVMVHGTAEVGRFLLNLLRCPDLTNITYSGVPGGRSIAATGTGAVTTGGGPGMPGPGGRPGPGGMPYGIGPGGMPGLAGGPQAAATSGAAGVEPGSPNEPISLQISATLAKSITTPTPPGGGGGGMMAGGMGGPMMGPAGMGGMGGPSGIQMGPGGLPIGPGSVRPPGPGGVPGAPNTAAPAAGGRAAGVGGIKGRASSAEE